MSTTSFDYKGFMLAAVGFSAILYAFSYAPTWHWDDWRIITLLCVGSACVVAWVIVELGEKNPLLDLRMFKNGGYSLGIGLTFVTTIGLFSLIFLLPLFLQTLRGLRAFDSGLMTLPQAIGAMITMPLAGRIYDRIGPALPAVAGLIITGLCSLWLQVLDVTTPDDTLRWILFFRGMGMGLAMMPIMTYALSSVPHRMTAQASSLLNVCRTVFASLGIAVFATMLDTFTKTNMATMVQTVTPDSVDGAPRTFTDTGLSLAVRPHSRRCAGRRQSLLLYQFVNLRAAVTAFEMDYVIGAVIVLLGIIPAMFLPFRTD